LGSICSLFAQTNTEHNAEKALRDLQIDTSTEEPNIPIPEIYETPPKIVEQIVGGAPEFKLFYFCRHHTSDELRKIVHEQFGTKLFNAKGKSTQITDYTVSSNPATNQLIARCPTREDVEAVLELLEAVDVPPIQVKIDCLVSEIYADFTFDRETTIAIENLFGEDIAMKPGGTAFGADVTQLVKDDDFLPAFPGASIRELIRSRMGLKIGYLDEDVTVLVDLLESRGYLKILMNPMIETINGKTAIVVSTQQVPLQQITKVVPGGGGLTTTVTTEIEYTDVVDSLEITPHVFSDGTIALETDILLGAKNTPDGVKQVPIVTKKEITNKENRIRSGESLIIGGLRKAEQYGVVRGVPILKDIPLLGFLFSGEDTEERAVETVFVLTPTYSTGGRPKQEVMEGIRKKHEPASPNVLQEAITDFFGNNSEQQERKVLEAERSMLAAEAEKMEVRSVAREREARAERLTTEAEKATSDAAKTQADAEKMMAEAKKLMAEAQAKAKAAEKAKKEAEAEKVKAAEEKAKKEDEKPEA
jgi:Flp pilus assembly secretin CpaC